jgi:hypothetical protein
MARPDVQPAATAAAPRVDPQRGIALISSILVLALMVGVLAGVTALVITDVRVRTLDNTRTQAFYTAHAGLEKLTADLGDLFSTDVSPAGAAVNAIANAPPALNAAWLEPDGTDGYTVTFPADVAGNPLAAVANVQSGPFQGLVGLATPFEMRVTARLPDRSEASLTRTLQTVAIPVFQFGIFSENDLHFFAGPNFNFGGRVHTNSDLYLASGNGSTLTLADRVTAVGEVVRTNLSNGWDTTNNYTGVVRAIRAPNVFRNLLRTEGSLVGTVGSAVNEPLWTNISTGDYNSNLINGRTGARRLDLPLTSSGGTPIDLIRRPVVNEDVTSPGVLAERFFTLASLRILLSDTAADISGLPTVTAPAPVNLAAAGGGFVDEPAWYVISNATPHFAESAGLQQAGDAVTAQRYGSRTPVGESLLGGFIKIEMQRMNNTWVDVTQEILMLGIAGRQLANPANGAGGGCAEPSPDAVIRIQRFRDRDAGCWETQGAASRQSGRNFSPMVLYDTREAVLRDGQPNTDPVRFGGIMHYIELDARNLGRWFQGLIGVSGNQALNQNGFTVYFSDRRNNRNGAGNETGEYGVEDIVNPTAIGGLPNGILETGEDVNGINGLEMYGQTPRLLAGMTAPLDNAARPWTDVDPGGALVEDEEMAIARRNPAIFFRRALKLVNGGIGNLPPPGLTIASENPVYVQGNWNAGNNNFPNPHIASAILTDAITLLSNNWNDRRSFTDPHDQGPRTATDTGYRFAVIAGKGLSFPQPAGAPQDFGTDGGAHNFLRYLENWGGRTLSYRGSIISLFTSRQALGIYKCCADVYSPPTRGYNFDVEFLTPVLLPPNTPMFRDVNVTGFSQIIRPR